MKNGKIIEEDGSAIWFKNDIIHRDRYPAIITPEGDKIWMQKGEMCRFDGPAVEGADGYKAYYILGIRHNSTGPAIIHPDGKEEYYFYGVKALDKDVWNSSAWRDQILAYYAGCFDDKFNEQWDELYKIKETPSHESDDSLE